MRRQRAFTTMVRLMNPLAEYLLKAIKAEPNLETRRAEECEVALAELGFWLLSRPADTPLSAMPETNIAKTCLYVESFKQVAKPYEEYDAFDVMVDVYMDPVGVLT